jgi:hypothetical protein
MNQLCATEVDPNSRMCTSKEVMLTVNPPVAPVATRAWLHPVFQPFGKNANYSNDLFLDYSGAQGEPGRLSCSGWLDSHNTSNGLSVETTSGSISAAPCGFTNAVACCAPAASAVAQ